MKQPSTSIRIIAFLAVGLAFLFPSIGQAAKAPKFDPSAYKTVAIWSKSAQNGGRPVYYVYTNTLDLDATVNGTLQEILLQKGYEVLEPSKETSATMDPDTVKAMEEMGITPETSGGAGLAAKGAFIVTLNSVSWKSNGGTANVSLQLIDVKERKVLWAGSGSYDSNSAGRRAGSRLLGGLVGGVAGSVASDQVTGEKTMATVIQEAVKAAAKDIPKVPAK